MRRRRTRYLLALAEAAGVALAAALFADHRRLAALRAQVADLQHGLFQRHGGERHLVHLALAELVAFGQVVIQGAGDAVRQGAHPVRAESQRSSATYTGQLPEDFLQAGARFHRVRSLPDGVARALDDYLTERDEFSEGEVHEVMLTPMPLEQARPEDRRPVPGVRPGGGGQ